MLLRESRLAPAVGYQALPCEALVALACDLDWPARERGLDKDSFVLSASSVPHTLGFLPSIFVYPQLYPAQCGSPMRDRWAGSMANKSWGTSWTLEEIHHGGSSPSQSLLFIYLGLDLRLFVYRHQEGKLGARTKGKAIPSLPSLVLGMTRPSIKGFLFMNPQLQLEKEHSTGRRAHVPLRTLPSPEVWRVWQLHRRLGLP